MSLEPAKSPALRVETIVERAILGSRWLLALFCLGLGLALGLYALSFVRELWHLASHILEMKESDVILAMLSLIDAALVASLMVMVMITSYENFVSQFAEKSAGISWIGQIDSGSLKIKIASAIVAISSIHLLRVFLNAAEYPNDKIFYAMMLHITFIASAFFLALTDYVMGQKAVPAKAGPGNATKAGEDDKIA